MANAAETFLDKIVKTDFNSGESVQSLAKTFDYVKDKLTSASHCSSILTQCRLPQHAAAVAMIL